MDQTNKITGIGGIYFKAKNPDRMRKWYSDMLHINSFEHVGIFTFRENHTPEKISYAIINWFSHDSDYFSPSLQEVMINYRVANLEAFLRDLGKKNISQIGKIEELPYGKFGWIMDLNGYKIELWEANDEAFSKVYQPQFNNDRVTGLGGVFFKCQDVKDTKAWYGANLGLPIDEWGATLSWQDQQVPGKTCYTAWSPFSKDTDYFHPSEKSYMFNYRVKNLMELLSKLKKEGVEVIKTPESYDYGHFGWILDPEGNKIELWEPIDEKLIPEG